MKSKHLCRSRGVTFCQTPACLFRLSFAFSPEKISCLKMKQSYRIWKQGEGEERKDLPRRSRLCTPGSARPPRRSSARENPFLTGFLVCKAGKSSITNIRLQVSNSLRGKNGITAFMTDLSRSKSNRAPSRGQVESKLSRGGEDACGQWSGSMCEPLGRPKKTNNP